MLFIFSLPSERASQMCLKGGQWNIYQLLFDNLSIYLGNCAHCGAYDGNFDH